MIIMKKTNELIFSAATDSIPFMDDTCFALLLSDVAQNGIMYPLIVCEDQIVDGRARWTAAKKLNLEYVPTFEISAESVSNNAYSLNVNRRHLSLSQFTKLIEAQVQTIAVNVKKIAVNE